MKTRFDVAIVGYGPVGAMAALQLARAGASVVLIDRTTGILDIPRAVGIDGEAMRAFQRLGMAEEVDAIVQPRREKEELYFTNSKRERLFGMDMPPRGVAGWRDIAFFDQPQLEAVLREKIASRGDIEVLLGVEVREIEQSADRVTVRGSGASGEVDLEANWLIGCDGASSFVRETIGSKWESLGYDQDWLVIDVIASEDAGLPLTMMQVCDPERLTTYIPVRDPYRRWEFQVIDGDDREDLCSEATIERMLDPWLPRDKYEIRRAAVYQFHAATATQWRDRRILLAGDAAHQTPPFLGQGLNSGFRDAVCLGWKLPLVLSGESDAALLDSYQAERGPHAHDLVDRAVGIGQLMETVAAREAGRPDPYSDAELRAAPADGQVVPPIRAGILLDAQIGENSRVGRLLAQPDVRDADGTTGRLDAWLGGGFAVLGRTPDDLRLAAEARAIVDRLGVRQVAIDGFEVVEGWLDPLFEEHAAVVVRPDRLIFGVVDESHDLDAIVLELGRKLALREAG
jgi:3-(3-hydroxy-phenyl)propionate hydroxylase